MGLLDNYTGIGMSPRPKWQHQILKDSFLLNAGPEIRRNGLLLLGETTVTDDWDDLAPDLVIFDRQFKPLSIIEITTHKECKAIIRKCHVLIQRFPDAEYFVYDYEEDLLYQYVAEENVWITSEEEEISSQYLIRPLMDYLQNYYE
ncbi:MAG: hypothetical protein K6A36_00225 [Paludibacteraceae bacterium]|nr:hypothetical protein [Paludibacteraceae bacterium]